MSSSLGQAVLELSTDDKKLNAGLRSAETRAQKVGKRLGGIGRKMSAGLTLPILAFGAAAFASANKIDEAFATIRTGTGATGDKLAGLQESFRTVFKNVPADAAAVASALAATNTMLDLTGQALEDVTKTALEAGKALGIDAAKLIEDTAKVLSIFNLEATEAERVMDAMFVVSQTTGIEMGALSSQLQSFGPVLANMGFSLTETTVIFGQLNTAGIDVTRVMPGINAWMRRTAAGAEGFSEAIADANKELTEETASLEKNQARTQRLMQQLTVLNARMSTFGDKTKDATRISAEFKRENLIAEIRKLRDEAEQGAGRVGIFSKALEGLQKKSQEAAGETIDLRKEFEKIIKEIAETEDRTEALNIATEAFGAEGAQRLLVAIKDGTFNIEEMTAALGDSEGAILTNADATRTASERLAIFKNNAMLAVEPIGQRLVGALEDFLPLMMDLLGGLTKGIELFGKLPSGVQTAVIVIIALVAAIGPLLVMLPALIAGFTILLGPVGLIVLAIVGLIAIGVLLVKNWDTIKADAIRMWTQLKDLFRRGVGFIRDNWKLILAILIPGSIIITKWRAIFNVLMGFIEGFANAYVGAINAIIGGANRIQISIPRWVPQIGGNSFGVNIPRIPSVRLPRLAEGGIALEEQLAIIGDEPEAIIPLERLGNLGPTNQYFIENLFGVDDLEDFVTQANLNQDRRGGIAQFQVA